MGYDLFLSYSRGDNARGRITDLLEQIQKDFQQYAARELRVFFDQKEIQGMEDWRQRILQGLRESHLLLACFSPAYLQSEHCAWEFTEYLKREFGRVGGFHGVAPVYFVAVPGWEQPEFERECEEWVAELRRRQHFDLRPWHDQGRAALHEAAVRERLDALNRQIGATIQRGERAAQSPGNVDAHNPHFLGRSDKMHQLRQNFVEPGRIGVLTAVNGMGGLGKTALAIQYAHAYADQYGGGRWQVRCAGKDDLRLALAELAPAMGFAFTEEEQGSADRQLERVRHELKRLADARAPHRCLLILDNVDRPGLLDPALVARLNGGDWLHVLATTRLGENELHGAHHDRSFLPIDELSATEALALIESYQPEGCFRDEAERAAAAGIVRLLGCFTLAVEAAAVYLGRYAGEVSCAAFLARLEREGLAGLDQAAGQGEVRVRHGEARLSATLTPTLERLGERERLALKYAALLPPDQVALPWLRGLVAGTYPEIGREAAPGYPDPWNAVLRGLLSQRLLQATAAVDEAGQPRVVRVHRLVQQLMWGDGAVSEREARQWAVDKWVRQRVSVLEEETQWQKARWEVEPLAALALRWAEQEHPQAGWLLRHAGLRHYALAEWVQAEALLRRALAVAEARYDSEHPNVVHSLINLAKLLRATNRLAEAEPLLRRAQAISEAAADWELGDPGDMPDLSLDEFLQALIHHPDDEANLNDLAQLLQETNRWEEVEALLRRMLASHEKSDYFHPDDPGLVPTLTNLARLLQATERMAEAEALLRRALAIMEANYGPEHLKVAVCLSNLARLLQATHRVAETEELLRWALAIVEASYGPEHPLVAERLDNLGRLLQAPDRLEEAEALRRRALVIDEANFGPEDPGVANLSYRLAELDQAADLLEVMEGVLRGTLASDEASYGPEHPDVAFALNKLAKWLQATDQLEEAELLLRRALAIVEASYGPEHYQVGYRLNELATLLQATNQFEEAELLLRRALAIDEASYKSGPPFFIANSLDNLVGLLQATNRLEEAEALLCQALAIVEVSYGPEHSQVAKRLDDLVALLQATNRREETEPLLRRALAIAEARYGAEHPKVAKRLDDLAALLQATNRLGEVEPLRRRSLEILVAFTRATGHSHPQLQTTANNYADLLRALGRSEAQIRATLHALGAEEWFSV